MAIGTLRVTEAIPAWKTVLDISELVPQDSWMLVGGLMTQVHAGLAGLASRATDDVDVLASLITDHAYALSQLHGSDRKRLRKAAKALAGPNEPAWLLLSPGQRIKGQDTMRILGS